MSVFTTIFAMITLFTVILCDDQVPFEAIKDTLTTITTIDRLLKSLQRSNMDSIGGNSEAEKLIVKVKWFLYGYFRKLLDSFLKRRFLRPRVQVNKGVDKTKIIKYPKDFFKTKVQNLLKIKEKKNK